VHPVATGLPLDRRQQAASGATVSAHNDVLMHTYTVINLSGVSGRVVDARSLRREVRTARRLHGLLTGLDWLSLKMTPFRVPTRDASSQRKVKAGVGRTR
jgi:hypothetical protein